MIEVKNLKKSFNGNTIFDNVNFTVEKGDSIVIIGGSGCGKSTLLRCLNRLLVPDSGEILFKGQNILDKSTDIDAYRRQVSMVFQSFNLFSHLNVMENMILAPMKVLKMGEKEAVEKAEHLLKTVAMENFRYKMPFGLSGGQKQRVAIARTLMMDPEAILFDEPTSALDPTMVDEVENVIAQLVKNGMTSVIVTHEMRFAKNIASKVIYLAEKSIYDTGTSEEIFEKPSKELTRQFIYRSRFFKEEVDADSIDYLGLASRMRAFIASYGLNKKQATVIDYITEELVYPIVKHSSVEKCNINIACNENGTGHKIMIEVPGIDEDPLTLDCLDELGLTIIKNFATEITSAVNGQGNHEITVVI